jgi:hypothetical protein
MRGARVPEPEGGPFANVFRLGGCDKFFESAIGDGIGVQRNGEDGAVRMRSGNL